MEINTVILSAHICYIIKSPLFRRISPSFIDPLTFRELARTSLGTMAVCHAMPTAPASAVAPGAGSCPLPGTGQHVPPQAIPISVVQRSLEFPLHALASKLGQDGTLCLILLMTLPVVAG